MPEVEPLSAEDIGLKDIARGRRGGGLRARLHKTRSELNPVWDFTWG